MRAILRCWARPHDLRRARCQLMKPRASHFYALLACVVAAALAGCRAKPPGKAESATVNWIKHHVTVGGKKDKNPLLASAENINAGKHVFGDYCVECHGRDGQNTGVPFAATM